MKVDLGKEKTEKEWQTSFEKFILAATPKWFTWIENQKGQCDVHGCTNAVGARSAGTAD